MCVRGSSPEETASLFNTGNNVKFKTHCIAPFYHRNCVYNFIEHLLPLSLVYLLQLGYFKFLMVITDESLHLG